SFLPTVRIAADMHRHQVPAPLRWFPSTRTTPLPCRRQTDGLLTPRDTCIRDQNPAVVMTARKETPRPLDGSLNKYRDEIRVVSIQQCASRRRGYPSLLPAILAIHVAVA